MARGIFLLVVFCLFVVAFTQTTTESPDIPQIPPPPSNPPTPVSQATAKPDAKATETQPTAQPTESPLGATSFLDSLAGETHEDPAQLLEEQCSKPTTISKYCILPEELNNFLGPNSTVESIGAYLISEVLINSLQKECPPGTWCLDSESSEAELDALLKFWTNASDFSMLCWPDISLCLDYITEFYFECDQYETYQLISSMDSLLCKMKEEPRASADCIRQTLKVLHISVADSKRSFKDLEASETTTDVCKSRRNKMTQNFLCTTALCDEYSAMLYEFGPWSWLVDTIDDLKKECSLEDLDCIQMAEQDILTNLLATVIEDEQQVYEKNMALQQLGARSAIVIVLVSVAAIGALTLVCFVVWRKRKMRVRIRDGMEYLEIKPEETDAFLEGMDEIGDGSKLLNQ